MKVNTEIIYLIKFNNKVKARLCYEFNVSAQTVARWIENDADGGLTKARAVKIIAEELGIAEDAILTDENN